MPKSHAPILSSSLISRRFYKLYECFHTLHVDPEKNINTIVKLCGELMGATCALYNRLDKGILCSLGKWNVPFDYKDKDTPEGHICYDVIQKDQERLTVIRNLSRTSYFRTDPNVKKYGLHTYIGHVVRFSGTARGALCVVYQKDYVPIQEDEWLMGMVASFIGLEEERAIAQKNLTQHEEKLKTTLQYLEQAYERLQGVNQAKSDFISIVSHELKTPLTSIKNAVGILLEKYVSCYHIDAQGKELLSIIMKNTERQIRMVHNLLDLAKIEEGVMPMKIKKFNIVPLVRDILQNIQFQIQEKKIKKQEVFSSQRVYAFADEDHIRRVIVNLIDNAIKFTPCHGTITIKILQEDTQVKVMVIDTGIGIGKRDLVHIFDKFYKVNRPEVRKVGGTGLGLVITKQIVEMHGGRIGVESLLNKGSTFYFTLPRRSL